MGHNRRVDWLGAGRFPLMRDLKIEEVYAFDVDPLWVTSLPVRPSTTRISLPSRTMRAMSSSFS